MSRTNPHDPELHLLRSIAKSAGENRGRTEIEAARFGVYAAIEAGDEDTARRWLTALRVAVTTYAAESVRAEAIAAIERIEARL
jgi:hypothetical protein